MVNLGLVDYVVFIVIVFIMVGVLIGSFILRGMFLFGVGLFFGFVGIDWFFG